GLALERATGTPLAEQVRLVLHRVGGENPMYMGTDFAGSPMIGASLVSTTVDFARYGRLLIEDADQVWGCNSAMIWLHENGHCVTHGFTVDQTPQQVEEWASAPPVEYLVASSVHPHMIELLESKDRRITFFHNYVGINERPVDMGDDVIMPYEDWMYYTYYPETVRAGSGLNAVTRACDIALVLGASRITLLGADSALRVSKRPPDAPHGSPEHMKWLREDCEMHADGGHALASGATAVTVEGEIDGRFWVTKRDMMISAHVANFAKRRSIQIAANN
ncbi:hypothetical protein LCGC14_0612200, partial [marine sediment metagenome]